MSWQSTMVLLLREFVSDAVETYTYSDVRLQEVIVAAATSVIMEIDFTYTYTVDIDNITISPDPVSGTSEIAFQVLVCRKAAQLIYGGEYRDASNRAINFKDGPSTIDSRGVAEAKKKMLDDASAAYNGTRTAYLTGNGMSGAAIVTPFNIGMYGGAYSTEWSGLPRNIHGNWS